jgi:hypothetical protein
MAATIAKRMGLSTITVAFFIRGAMELKSIMRTAASGIAGQGYTAA